MIESWFSTPIYFNFAEPQIKKEIEEEYFLIEKEILTNLKKESWGDNIDSTYDLNANLFKKFNLTKLESYVNQSVLLFLKELQFEASKIKHLNSWVNYSLKYNYQNQHQHMPAKVSGVYYIKSNEKDGNLRIHSPIKHLPDLEKAKNLSSNIIEYVPKSGKIILFPSWVEHSVRPNMTEDTRISISFNYD